jgi:Bacterial Ig-like domain (group 2)
MEGILDITAGEKSAPRDFRHRRRPSARCSVPAFAWMVLTMFGAPAIFGQGTPTAIPQISPGIISTQAGKDYVFSQSSGFSGDGGPATNAEMYDPQGIALDAAGNLYIADSGNDVIRVVNRQTAAITILGVTIQPGDIQTVIGTYSSTTVGFSGDGGPAGSAQLDAPEGIALDQQGNLYIADLINNRIRVVNLQSAAITVFGVTVQPGDINTIAGNASPGQTGVLCSGATDGVGDGCPAAQAAVFGPTGVAFDSAGNLYIAQYSDFRIREVSAATGIITTVAGDGIIGYSGDGGNPLDAQLFDPNDVKIDASGNIYIAEIGSNRVRVVNTQSTAITLFGVTIQPNTIQTVAGSGTAIANGSGNTSGGYSGDGGPANLAHLFNPSGIWLDLVGNLYIGDTENGVIREVDAQSGVISTIAGLYGAHVTAGTYTGDGGSAIAAQLSQPSYLLVDPTGNLWISDSLDEVIREVNSGSAVLDFPQTYPGSLSPEQVVTLQNIGNATLTISNEALSGSDTASFGAGTTCETSLAPGASCTFTFTFAPLASGSLSATFTVSESTPTASQSIALNGTGSSTVVAQVSITPSQLSFGNQTVGTTSAPQTLTLTNSGTAPLTPSGAAISFVNIIGVYPGDFPETDNCGTSLAAGASCTISISFAPQSSVNATAFVAIEGNAKNTPLLVSLAGTGTAIAGSGGGSPGAAPALQVIPGVISTVAGDGFGAGGASGDYAGDGGPAIGAKIYGAGCAVEDAAGNLYLCDTYNNVIRFVDMLSTPFTVTGITVQPGDIQTIAGSASAGAHLGGYSGDGGPAISAALNEPVFAALDKSGNIYFTDYLNKLVRVINTQSAPINVNGVSIPANDIQTVVGSKNGVCAQAVDSVGDGCPATSATLADSYQIAFDAAGNLYIADTDNEVVRAVNMGSAPATIAGVLIQPGQIQIVAGTLGTAGFAGDGGPAVNASLQSPVGLAVDRNENIYIADVTNWRIRVVNTQSTPITVFGTTIQSGTIQTVAGTGSPGYSGDFGPALAASFTIIYGLSLDQAGNLYFADSFNNRIRVIFASTGMIRTVAGTGYGAVQLVNGKPVKSSYTGGYTGDGGPATSAELYYPFDMTIDAAGNMYLGDILNDVFRQVSATPAGYAFPDTPVNATSAPQIYTFSNISTQAIAFSGLTVSANFKQVPSGQTDCSASITLPPAGICQLALEFAPTAVGPLAGVAQTTNTAGVQTIPLSGTGTAVDGAVLQTITVTPGSPSIATPATQQFQATGDFSDGSTQNLSTGVIWTSSNPAVATINATTGLATAVTAGTTQITAMLGTVASVPVTLTVTAGTVTLQSITVNPGNPVVTVGGTQQLSATGTYSDSSTHDLTASVTWSSAIMSVATISAAGLASGVSAGTSKIQAALSGITGSATLTVNNPVPAINTLAPAHAPAGAGFALTVNGTNFVSTSTVNFNGKTQAPTYVSATQLTTTIPASDASAGGTVGVTVTNSAPGGGTSSSASFTLDDFTLGVPPSGIVVTAAQPTQVSLTITPTANGFASPIQLSVSGVPSGISAQFLQTTVTPGNSTATVTLTLSSSGALSALSHPMRRFPFEPMACLAALLAAALLMCRERMERRGLLAVKAAVILLSLAATLGAGFTLVGCNGGFGNVSSSSGGQQEAVTVTATSGTLQHSVQITFTVQAQ